jgi:hypothetical protein
MPKYQVVMKGYCRIPNNNLFSNVQQENGRVVKGSGIIGFELDPPQQCLEEASGDLRAMGCSIFFKKCQEVDTASNLVFLGVPNSISEDTVKETVDEVLQKLEDELIHDDKDYKLTVRQKEQWIKYAITKEYTQEGCPGRIKRKRRRSYKQQTTLVWLLFSTFIAQMNSVLQPYTRSRQVPQSMV